MKLNKEIFEQILADYKSNPKNIWKYVVAVDFDNCLCYSQFPECGDPTPIVDFIKSIQDLDIYIVLWTCRNSNENALNKALQWCYDQGLKISYVNTNVGERIALYGDSRKISCNMLIDDTNWGFDMNDFVIDEAQNDNTKQKGRKPNNAK